MPGRFFLLQIWLPASVWIILEILYCREKLGDRIIPYQKKKPVAFESECSGKVLKLQHSQKAGAEAKCFFIYLINSLELDNPLLVL